MYTARGAVYILFLNADGTVRAETKISSTQGGLTGPLDDYDMFGYSVASLGDVDGDGVADLAVGAHYDGDGGTDREPEERLANLTPLFISVLGGGGGGGGLGGGGAALPFSGERVAYNFAATKRAPTPRGEYGVQQGLV